MPTKPRSKNDNESRKVHPTITVQATGYFQHLVKIGYGKNRTEVAAYLIQRGLDDLIRTGVLKPEHALLAKDETEKD